MQIISNFIAGFLNSVNAKGKDGGNGSNSRFLTDISFTEIMKGVSYNNVNRMVVGNPEAGVSSFRKRDEEVKALKKKADKYRTVYDALVEIEHFGARKDRH